MKKLTFHLSGRPYEVCIGTGILSAEIVQNREGQTKKAFIIADKHLKNRCDRFARSLKKAGWKVVVRYLKVSESLKDLYTIYPLYGWLLQEGADRHSVVFALGGGVIGDVVGFVAGTYLRGVQWIGVPTTLLSQVDSCLGGKTGLNHSVGKNLIGVFHHPSQIICDLSFLDSLPPRERISGLGEVIKYGLISDPWLYSSLQKSWDKILVSRPSRKSSLWEEVIYRCLELKARIVEKDEKDSSGVREILNFGHTLGHALEAQLGYRKIKHGEAVIWGMRIANRLSSSRGFLQKALQEEVDSFLESIPVPQIPRALKNQDWVSRLKWDKKSREGRVRFVLLKKIGETVLDSQVENEEVVAAIDWVRARA